MKIGDIKQIKAARRYSNAIFKSAVDADLLEKVYQDLIFVQETISINSSLKEFLKNPIVSKEDKKDIINKLFSAHVEILTLDFLFVLTDSGRIDILSEVLNQFSIKYNEINNIIKPNIISAVELDSNQKMQVISKLEQKLSKKVIPEYIIDEGIIGGLVIEINDNTFDCSLRSKFYRIKQELIKGNRYGSD